MLNYLDVLMCAIKKQRKQEVKVLSWKFVEVITLDKLLKRRIK